MDPNQKTQKKPQKYLCEFCDYISCNKKDYTRHVLTDKHKILTNPNKKTPKTPKFICNCGKSYKHSSSLCAHKKKCNVSNTYNLTNYGNNSTNDLNDSDDTPSTNVINETFFIKDKTDTKNTNDTKDKGNNSGKDDLINYLVKENQEFKSLILEIIKKDTYTTNNNISNKTFNLNVFLNETCKDAMNIMDFVDSIKLQLSDLENVGKLGYVEGISNIITKNLNNLDIEKRPIHCTDSKREVLYVKDEGKWYNDSKEEENENKKIRKAIKQISHKNTKLLQEFKAKYPDCVYSDSKKSDQYNKIIIESLNDSKENENKIIKKIAKEVVVGKD